MFEFSNSREASLQRALRRLSGADTRYVSFKFFSASEVEALRLFALQQDFRRAQSEITHNGRSVFQDFDVCFPAPRIGVFDALSKLLEKCVCNYGAPVGFALNDFAIQHYPKSSRGIGVHRDGLRYPYLVFIVTLAGSSRLFSCDDRMGSNKRRINDKPGRLVVLSAEGFANRVGEDARPLHGVDLLKDGRLSLGFRFNPALAS